MSQDSLRGVDHAQRTNWFVRKRTSSFFIAIENQPVLPLKIGMRTTTALEIFILAKWMEELEEGKGTLFQATTSVLVRRIARTGAVIP